MTESSPKSAFAAELGALGYPAFSHLETEVRQAPAEVLLNALNRSDLDARVAEGLPWLVLTYVEMDWDWLLRTAVSLGRQNRLGFAVTLASEVAQNSGDNEREDKLRPYLETLERLRLAQEDTFCRESMTQAERAWVREHRSATAAHWNLLTDIVAQQLSYSQ
ncbi:MAG TPA: hypothetical protein VEK84_01630 [Terriglobales bacterium]|nr:hypothetical protein [Terriglobales bacterium]